MRPGRAGDASAAGLAPLACMQRKAPRRAWV